MSNNYKIETEKSGVQGKSNEMIENSKSGPQLPKEKYETPEHIKKPHMFGDVPCKYRPMHNIVTGYGKGPLIFHRKRVSKEK